MTGHHSLHPGSMSPSLTCSTWALHQTRLYTRGTAAGRMNFFDLPFSSPPTCATRIDEDHHAFSLRSCWKRNERQSYRKPAQPWPKPSQPQENTRAVAQLEQCAQIPAMRLPCTMKAARVGGVAKAWYLDDQSRVCCALPCVSSPCPFHSACGRIINDRIPLCEDTHTSHYCSRCYESMQPNVAMY